MMRPFQLSLTGQITRDEYKALLLQLDPDDDEAEQKVRMSIERQSEREIAKALRDQMNAAIPDSTTEANAQQAPAKLRRWGSPVRDALRRALQSSADLGMWVAVDQFESIGFGFDYTLVNQDVAEWVNTYTSELYEQVLQTSDKRVRTAVNEWIDNGEPLAELRKELEPTFGRKRAEVIASTEVTRAYAEGNLLAYKQSDVVEMIEWRSAADERVCIICGPLHGKRGGIDEGVLGDGETVYGIIPPAHPRCRCWIVPVVS